MSIAESNALHILHVVSAVVLVALIFYACAAAPQTRGRTMMWQGIASLVVLLTGIRMWQAGYGFDGAWPIVKLVSWLVLSALSGLAYRRREKVSLWLSLASVFAGLAVAMVYLRPF